MYVRISRKAPNLYSIVRLGQIKMGKCMIINEKCHSKQICKFREKKELTIESTDWRSYEIIITVITVILQIIITLIITVLFLLLNNKKHKTRHWRKHIIPRARSTERIQLSGGCLTFSHWARFWKERAIIPWSPFKKRL